MLFILRFMINPFVELGGKFWLVVLTVTAWALWFGSLIAAFVFVSHFFKTMSHDAAGNAANNLFAALAGFEWAMAVVTFVGAGALFISFPSKRIVLTLFGLCLAGGAMITVTLGLMPRMNQLISAHDQGGPEFIKLHVQSMIAMSVQALLLAATAVPLIALADPTFRRKERIQEDAVEPVLPKRGGLSQRI